MRQQIKWNKIQIYTNEYIKCDRNAVSARWCVHIQYIYMQKFPEMYKHSYRLFASACPS